MAEQPQERSLAVALAEKYEMKTEAFLETVKKTVMPSQNVSNEHLAAFLMVAKEHDLNPMTEQIHAFPSKGGVKAMIGVDGYIALANRHPQMDGMQTILNRDADGNHEGCFAKDGRHRSSDHVGQHITRRNRPARRHATRSRSDHHRAGRRG